MVILLSFFSCQRSARSFFQEGVSHELARYRARHIYDVHYQLSFNVPEKKDQPVTGKTIISFKPLKARHGIILDFQPGEENIHNILVNGQPGEYSIMHGHIYLDANQLVPRQNNDVEIEFTASDQALNRSADFMYTLLVPDRASTAFPCFDQPDIKATYNLSLEIPGSWTALSNGALTQKIEEDGGRRELFFRIKQPISTYVFAFTAGKFDILTESSNGRTINILHRETDEAAIERNMPRIFQQHFEALEWMEEYTGISYPYEKFDMAILPGFQYSGMEHPGAIWYRDTRLLLDEEPSLDRLISKASLIAHETAHMWFGNLVTMNWFDDVWLKEVFAGFFADKIIEEQFPEVNHNLQFVLRHYPRAYSIDRSAGAHPIKQKLENMKMAGTLYGPIIYNKAPIVFRQLENIMGEHSLRTAIKEYLTVYSHANADWADLVTIFDKYSEHNISQWSNSWVYGAGMPEISYNFREGQDLATLKIITQYDNVSDDFPSQLLAGTIVFTDTVYPVPEFFIRKEKEALNVKTSKSGKQTSLIMPNGQGMGYGFFEMQESDIKFLLEFGELPPDEDLRAAVYINAFENFLEERFPSANFFQFLLSAIGYEEHPLLQNYLLDVLQIYSVNFIDITSSDSYYKAVEHLLYSKFAASQTASREAFFLAWIKLARSEWSTVKMREVYLGSADIKGFVLSEANRTQLALEAAMRSEDNYTLVEQELERITNADRLRRLEFMLPAISADQLKRDAFFEQLQKAQNRNPEPWVLEALYFLHHPLHAGQGIRYITPALEMLEEIQQTGDIFFPQNWLAANLQNYHQKAVAQKVENYLDRHPDLPENLRLKVYQMSDYLLRSANMQ